MPSRMPSRLLHLTASACLTLAVAVPAYAQGKSGGKKPVKAAAPPPSTSALSTPTAGHLITTASPFAWMDDASLIDAGSISLGISMLRWHGSGTSETIVPVIDAAIGLTSRVQLGASVPRVAGGLGTTFFSAKIGVLKDDVRHLQVAVSPTLEIMGGAVTHAVPSGEGRAHWGLPVSVHVDREKARIYASSGYFSPGIWYAGAGVGTSIGDRAGLSGSFSRAWMTSTSASGVPAVVSPRRNEISGVASYNVRPNLAVFGSVGRTIGTTAVDGAGTTLVVGMSLTAAVPMLAR